MIYVQVAGGLVVLLFGGDLLVRGAVSLTQRLDIPPLVIGLTVVAFGTSAPELVVSIDAVLSGVPAIAIGNVVGSNIANVLLVLGLPAIIYPIVCEPDGMRRDGSLMLAATVVFVAFCWGDTIGRWQGLLLVVLLWQATRNNGKARAESFSLEYESLETTPHKLWLAITFVLAGCVGLVIGAGWLIDGAVAVARSLGVSEAVVGLTLVALGTSLPELATSLVAALRHHGEVAIGNVLGSNMFNLLGIMGVAAMVAPEPVPVPVKMLHFDIWVMFGVSLMLGFIALRRIGVGRVAGAFLFVAYLAYIVVQFQGISGIDHKMG
jgi:cation:H+ antiporter